MTLQSNDSPIRFDIFTRAWDTDKNEWVPDALKAEVGTDNKMRLRGIASSSVRDLHGDIIMESALLDMEKAANQNLTIFGNHSYDVPEDVYGSAERAALRRNAGVDDKGEPFHLLDLDIGINEENERAVKTWRAIRKGTKLGLSIGAMIPPGGAKIDKKTGTLIIEHLDLLETSIVGIPANPKSWVENAVKSFREGPKTLTYTATTTNGTNTFNNMNWSFDVVDTALGQAAAVEPDLTLKPLEGHERHDLPDSAFACPEKRLYPHHTASGAVDKPHLRAALSRVGDPKNDQCGKAHLEAHAKALGMGDRDEKSVDHLTDGFDEEHFLLEAEPELTDAAMCPTCGKGRDAEGCSDAYHKDAEPDLEKVRVRVTVDTDEKDKTPAAPQSEPAASDDGVTNAASATVAQAQEAVVGMDAEVTTAFTRMAELIAQLTDEVVTAKKALRDAQLAQAEAERQRDAIAASASDVIANTKAIVQKLADIPLGPRAAVVREAGTDLSALEGVYTREFLELLRS